MYPKIRKPLITWMLTLITGGIYLPFWIWRLSKEINFAEQFEVFPVTLWKRVFLTLLAFIFLVLLFIAIIDSMWPTIVLFVLMLLGLFFIIQVMSTIGGYIQKKDKQLGTGESFSHALCMILMFMLANAGVAYIQAGINRIIKEQQSNS